MRSWGVRRDDVGKQFIRSPSAAWDTSLLISSKHYFMEGTNHLLILLLIGLLRGTLNYRLPELERHSTASTYRRCVHLALFIVGGAMLRSGRVEYSTCKMPNRSLIT